MKTILMALSVCAVMLMPACSNDQPAASPAAPAQTAPAAAPAAQADLSPEELGQLGAEIHRNPAEAQRVLSERGLNEQTFAQAVRKVSEDPSAARRYADAYKKASA